MTKELSRKELILSTENKFFSSYCSFGATAEQLNKLTYTQYYIHTQTTKIITLLLISHSRVKMSHRHTLYPQNTKSALPLGTVLCSLSNHLEV